jgi:hypothetical protein
MANSLRKFGSIALRALLVFVLSVAFILGIQAAVPAYACACGAFAPSNDATGSLEQGTEASIISQKDGEETIEMKMGINSMTPQTGLIFPTPSPATVSLGSEDDFVALSEEMTPERKTAYDWWDFEGFGFGSASAPNVGGASNPQVLSRVQLGPVEAATLKASDSKGLEAWLSDNGYGLRPEVTALLSHYTDAGWYFVALKLTGSEPLKGYLDPLVFTFQSEKLVYPMYLSRAATMDQEVYLYIFADHKSFATFADNTPVYGQTTTWARAVKSSDLKERGSYLTAVSLFFRHPSQSVEDDLTIGRASDDSEVNTVLNVTEKVSIFGIPAGPLLTVFGIIVLIVIIMGIRAAFRRSKDGKSRGNGNASTGSPYLLQ